MMRTPTDHENDLPLLFIVNNDFDTTMILLLKKKYHSLYVIVNMSLYLVDTTGYNIA